MRHSVYRKSGPIFRPRALFGRRVAREPGGASTEDDLTYNRLFCIGLTVALLWASIFTTVLFVAERLRV